MIPRRVLAYLVLVVLCTAAGVVGQTALESAVARANALLERAQAESDADAAKATVREALAALDDADGADADAAAAYARWQLATHANQLSDYEAELAAWPKVAAFYQGAPETRSFARAARRYQAAALARLDRPFEAYEIQRTLYEECRAELPADSQELVDVRWDLAVTLNTLNRAFEAVPVWAEIIAHVKSREPVDEEMLLAALGNQVVSLESMERRDDADDAHREIQALLERLGRRGTEAWWTARMDHAWNIQHNGRPEAAVPILREVLQHEDYSGRDAVRFQRLARLGYALDQTGRPQEALPLLQQADAGLRDALPADDPEAYGAEFWLAGCLNNLGRRPEAIEVMTRVVERGRAGPPSDSSHLDGVRSLAAYLRAEGDLERARRLLEDALQRYESATLQNETAPEFRHVQTRTALARTLVELGDYAGGLAIYDAVLEKREQVLPDDSAALNALRTSVALVRFYLGDFEGARPLEEKALRGYRASFPDDSIVVNRARINLGATLSHLGDSEASFRLHREAEAALAGKLEDSYSLVLVLRYNLAGQYRERGDYAESRRRYEEVLATMERAGLDGRTRYLALGGLGRTLWRLGETDRAEQLLREAIAGMTEAGRGHVHTPGLRRQLLLLLRQKNDDRALMTELNAVLRSLRGRLLDVAPLSTREHGASAAQMRKDVEIALSVLPPGTGSFDARLFGMIETLRSFAGPPGVDRFFTGGDELEGLRQEALHARRRLNDLVAGATTDGESAVDADALARAARERDRAETALRVALGQRAPFEITAAKVVEALSPDTASAGFFRYQRRPIEEGEPDPGDEVHHYVAHVVDELGAVHRVELGDAAEIDALVETWREAVGQPIVRSRRRRHGDGDPDAAAAAAALRARVLDPVFAQAPDAERWFLCLDGALHLVPLDALPDGDGLVGTSRQLAILPSFAALVAPQSRNRPPPSLLAVGGVKFNAELDGTFRGTDGSGPGGRLFRPLPGTAEEVASLAALFEEVFGAAPELLTADTATKDAVGTRAAAARYLHIATHGYFAPETVKSTADTRSAAGLEQGFGDAVVGLAPSTLCGLAFAGANRGRDSLGRVPGILTAEELAGIDLRRCELAVLSACETNVGIERAGQGVQSLQAALHAAGVDTAITSLWQVSDQAARDLMLDFYTRLWVQEKPPATALWEAKMQLQKRGAPERDWAGWVLTGTSQRRR